MAPIFRNILSTISTHIHTARSDFSSVKDQWQNPNDILSILTIIGADIVRCAVAQLSGHPSYITPVAFSFGWVGYALSMVLDIMGEGRLMPSPDCDCTFVNAKSQYFKQNRSWILGRLVRDHDKNMMKAREHDRKTKEKERNSNVTQKGQTGRKTERPSTPALTVTFFETYSSNMTQKQGVPRLDWVYWTGIVVILIQLGIAVVPGAVDQDWTILTVAAIGTILALIGGALPKWREEKWNGRRLAPNGRSVVCLTRGNGYSDVMVIISEGTEQYRLEDIANARDTPVPGTLGIALILCIAQILLLLVVAGLNNHAWFLLAIGALGIVQNALAAGYPRDLSTTGIHLKKKDSIEGGKVMEALMRAEEKERYVGISLLPIFFPGGLRPKEEEWRDNSLRRYKEEEEEEKARRKAQGASPLVTPPIHQTQAAGVYANLSSL